MAESATREMVISEYTMPVMTQVAEFIIWSSAGAFIIYLRIYRSLVNPKKNNLRQTGAIGLLVPSLAAVAPPAMTGRNRHLKSRNEPYLSMRRLDTFAKT